MRKRTVSFKTPDDFSKAAMEEMNMKFVVEIFGMIKEIREDRGFKEVPRNCSTGRNWISDNFPEK